MGAGNSVKERIFCLLKQEPELTRQEIAAKLSLSMPTTLQNITELAESGLIEECGAAESSGGRKARKLCLRRAAGLALGIDVGLHEVQLVLTDLLGEALFFRHAPTTFRDASEWYAGLGKAVRAFLEDHAVNPSHILGAGLSFPGILDGEQIVRSHIFGLSHVSLDRFRRCIPFPLTAANDANCACFADRSAHGDYVYLSLNESVGGAVMYGGRLLEGSSFQAGEIGHMVLVPGGDACYCGKHGCADAYLSPRVLAGSHSLAGFFRRAEDRDPEALGQLDRYLLHLALLLTNLRMLLNFELVIGGRMRVFLEPYLPVLYDKMKGLDRFARDIDYVALSTQHENACAAGAAALALEAFGCQNLFHSL